MNADSERVLSFWFGLPATAWFQSPPEDLDARLRNDFGPLVHAARAGELDSWSDHLKASLALVLLLDQFPRNIFRGSREAFASDAKALQAAARAVAKGFDKDEVYSRAQFFYIPFQHDESLVSQVASVSLFEAAAVRCEGQPHTEMMRMGLEFAVRHRDCILRFGRFPARNAALGRESTEEEKAYLEKNAVGF